MKISAQGVVSPSHGERPQWRSATGSFGSPIVRPMGPTYDVAIMGGGMAGSLLARQIRRQIPETRVLLVERSKERRWKVGESTVDICGA